MVVITTPTAAFHSLAPEDLSFNDMAQGMVDMMAAKNAGLDNAELRTPQSTSPTSFRNGARTY